jgi:hypothetical protein
LSLPERCLYLPLAPSIRLSAGKATVEIEADTKIQSQTTVAARSTLGLPCPRNAAKAKYRQTSNTGTLSPVSRAHNLFRSSSLATHISLQWNNTNTFTLTPCVNFFAVRGTKLARQTNHTSRHTLKIMIALHRDACTAVNAVLFGLSLRVVLTIVGHANLTLASSDVHSITATSGDTTVHNAVAAKLTRLAIFQP